MALPGPTPATIQRRTSRLLRLCAAAVLLVCSAARADGPASGDWNFRVLLDDKPIGSHRFTLKSDGGQRVLDSQAAFDVKVLGFTAYRYRHDAVEQWRGDCLAALDAKTDDDGKALSVKALRNGDSLDLQGPKGAQQLDGCVMSFAYWNPAMRKQTRLLNAQTGEYEKVRIEPLGNATVEAQGKTVAARRYRLTGPEQPVDLWYGADGDWLALESMVSGGKRKLTYRRE